MRPVGTIKVIFAVLGGVALFFLVNARIESPKEHQAIRVMDVAVGLMLCIAFSPRWVETATTWSRMKAVMVAMLVWLGISGSLLALHEFQIFARTTWAFRAHARHSMSETYGALNSFRRDCGEFPTEEEGLIALCTDPGLEGWNGPYVTDSNYLDDVWHHRFQYELRDGKPLLWSSGADGKSGTEDDIIVEYETQVRRE
ncbi:MAG: type II secretion system protein GspG [Pirellulaceae bacterium]